MSKRDLIRPNLSKMKNKLPYAKGTRKKTPDEQTYAECYYYLKQMRNDTPMVVRFKDDEEVRGTIEWYDKDCIKITRDKKPNLLVPKHSIKYLYKQE